RRRPKIATLTGDAGRFIFASWLSMSRLHPNFISVMRRTVLVVCIWDFVPVSRAELVFGA
ncbi:MAG: hypothetical protein JSU64_07870, partial [candidate division WOR-3 bacterium]